MTAQRTRRTLSFNVLVNMFGQTLPILSAFITVPFYIHAIGAPRYGIVSLTWILLGYLGVLDFGLSRASANALGRLGDAPAHERSPVLITTLYLNLAFGVAGSVLLYAVGGAALWRWLPLPGPLMHEAASAFPWMVPMLPLSMLGGVATGALESRERFLLSTSVNACGVILGQVLPLVCVLAFGPSLGVVIPAIMLVRLAVTLAMLGLVFWLEWPITSFALDFAWARRLFGYGAWVSVSSLISPLLDTFDQLLIGHMLGAAAVAAYAVPMNLATRSQVLAASLARTLFPRLSRESVDSGRQLTGRVCFSLIYVFGAVCGPAIIVVRPFLDLWIGHGFATVSALPAAILLFGAWMNGVAFLPYNQLQAQNRPNVTAYLHMAEIVPFLLGLWLLIFYMGLPGAALAWTLRVGADCLVLLAYAGSLRGMERRALPAIVLMGVCIAIATGLHPTPVISLVLASLLGVAFLCLGMIGEPKLRRLAWETAGAILPGSLRRVARAMR